MAISFAVVCLLGIICVQVYGQDADVDVCQLPMAIGPCDAVIPRYYYDSSTGSCKLFDWGGCGGNGNKFEQEDECIKTCMSSMTSTDVCQLPKDIGPCDGVFPRYYFDSSTGSCQQFDWGGCDGNSNNFQNEDECTKTCMSSMTDTEVCKLPPAIGDCDAVIPRYYYDTNTDSCKLFNWGRMWWERKQVRRRG